MFRVSQFNAHSPTHWASVIRGKGRGVSLGIPTINLVIPKPFVYEHGIYAGWVYMNGKKCMGAFHFGPVPVFDQRRATLEVHVIGEELGSVPATVSFELFRRIRDVRSFDTIEKLVSQIRDDIHAIKELLKKNDIK